VDAPRPPTSASPPTPPPVLDIRVRWRAGQVALALAGLLTLVALLRPLTPSSPDWLKAATALLIGLGVTASALLASLRGRRRPESLALYGFLVLAVDALGQVLGPMRVPAWPLMALLVGAPDPHTGLRPWTSTRVRIEAA